MIFNYNGYGKKKDKEEDSKQEEPEGALIVAEAADVEPRIIGFTGILDEDKCGELMYALITMRDKGRQIELPEKSKDVEDAIITYQPIEFFINTDGGSASDMFALYDLIRVIREDCPIHMVGLGRVYSAGTLLLASGTKGERKIGANCRVMVHNVIGHHAGSLHDLETEIEETKWTQQRYVEAMVKETDMTKNFLQKLLNRKVNAYLSPEEVVELGIADIII
jgi:ATP-dependent Clp endopeptidase proteolytic subunit ClpP|tara:strand:+ start:2338 stop:3003 length:666 start_codon:yes stop_codon:yes gene_type:complete